MYEVKIEKVGESLGIVLPQEILEELGLKEGDRLSATKTSEGLQLAAGEPEFEKVMAAYRKVSKKYKNALRELAK
ncbi:MAG: AbrB/MazE/SpoVT family DNA-binding domain-containing protein [Cyanobacteriota bacterium]|nr:AbrB/MazE/SpoVT family DNA-binding domain-containing protein [Cyanobacteriota bacterium]